MSSRRRHARVGWLVAAVAVDLVCTACGDSRDSGRAAADATSPATMTGESAAGATYTVRAGDYLSGIANTAGVSLDELVAVNGWPEGADHAIFPDDVIRLPADAVVPRPADATNRAAGADEPDLAAGGEPRDAATAVDACTNGRFFDGHTPVDGETIESVAAKVGVTVEDINRNNGYDAIAVGGGPATMPGGRPMFGEFQVGVLVRFPCRQNWPAGVEFSVVPEGEVCNDTSGAGDYTVRAGDTPAGLAARWGISEQMLLEANSRRTWVSADLTATSEEVDGTYRSFQPGTEIDVCTSFWGQ